MPAPVDGEPMLIEPYGNDQYFNAGRAVKLGIGAAAHPHWLTAEALKPISLTWHR